MEVIEGIVYYASLSKGDFFLISVTGIDLIVSCLSDILMPINVITRSYFSICVGC